MGQVAYAGGGGIALVDSGAGYIETATQATAQLSATITSGANVLIVFATSTEAAAGRYPTGITYNTTETMTLISGANANADWYGGAFPSCSIWYLVNPSVGSPHNIDATWNNSTDNHAIAWASFSGVSTIDGGAGNNSPVDTDESSASATATGFTSGDYAIGVALANSGSVTGMTAGQTALVSNFGSAGVNNQATSEYYTSSGALTWTIAGATSAWAACAAMLNP